MATGDAWSGQSHGWRYLAQRLAGDGLPGVFLSNELPMRDVEITDVLSGPPQLTGTISPVYGTMLASDGLPLLNEWGTAIYAEQDGKIRAGGILVGSGFKGPNWNLDATGFTTHMNGMPYPGNVFFVNTDPLDVVRHMWGVVQNLGGANLNMILDPYTQTNRRVGNDPDQAVVDLGEGSTTSDAYAYLLNWWDTTDLGSEIDKLAEETPFDYHERHQWNLDRTVISHFMDFGFPALGRRRNDLRFVQGENLQMKMEPNRDGSDYSNHVIVLGAGEGSEMIRGEARRLDGRVYRPVIIDDKSILEPGRATRRAQLELALRQQLLQIEDVIVREHPHAPFGSYMVGDEIRVQGGTDWIPDIDLWCRILSIAVKPGVPDIATLSIMRTDWVG